MLIGELIKEWRYAKRLNIRQAAKLLGLHFSTLSRIENNKTFDSKTMLTLINKLF